MQYTGCVCVLVQLLQGVYFQNTLRMNTLVHLHEWTSNIFQFMTRNSDADRIHAQYYVKQ